MENYPIKLLTLVFLLAAPQAQADDADNLRALAEQFFAAKVATQQPDATLEDLETYLALLADDVGYEHKPYRLLDAGEQHTGDGKQRMREGMTYYLGGNEKFEVKLISISVGYNAIAIQYAGVHEYRRGGEGSILSEQINAMEVLEIVGGKVSIIREYRE